MTTATKQMTIAVAGNPNCGKTTIFNALTGTRQKIGNWPGVTIERKEGRLKWEGFRRVLTEPFTDADDGRAAKLSGISDDVTVVDLPGIYALSAGSEDEVVARDYLLSGEPDAVIDIVDASNLERNLYLTSQLLELGLPVFVVLNMMDLAEAKNHSIDPERLARKLGCPVVAAVGTRRNGLDDLLRALGKFLVRPQMPSASVTYHEAIESAGRRLAPNVAGIRIVVPERWKALKAVEGDEWLLEQLRESDLETIESVRTETERLVECELDVAMADARYTFIQDAVTDAVRKGAGKQSISDRVDRVVMHRVLGIPIFFAAMYAVFWVTVSIGGAFIDFFDILFGTVFVDGAGYLLGALGSPDWLVTVLAGGLGAGIQTVSTFIPIIFFMFLLLSILEDSGYMSRAAFVMDRFMRWIGLPGKSFVPMLLGFGCTIPAIMGTRTLETTRDRYLTIFMTPFMSCGARLPVYALFAAALFPGAPGLVVFSLYIIGIVLAVLTGLVLKRTVFVGTASHFVMELPPYHAPRPIHIMHETGLRLRAFIKRAGIVIVLVVTVLSFLNSLGIDENGASFGNEDTQASVLARVGKAITPVFEPMGIREENWPATVGLFTGLFAKEAVVGTISSLYSQQIAAEVEGADEPADFSLIEGVSEALASIPEGLAGAFGGLADPLGMGMISGDETEAGAALEADASVFARLRSSFTPAGAYAYLLFVLIYFPCVAALGAAIKEMGPALGWLLAGYLTVLAWIVAVLANQIATGPTAAGILVPAALAALVAAGLIVVGRRLRTKSVNAIV